MISRARLRYVIFFLTAALVITIHIRTSTSRLFHCIRLEQVRQERLCRDLRLKQIELEALIQPASVLEQIGAEK